MSKAERLLSYSLLSLITCKPLVSVATLGTTREEEMSSNEKTHDKKGLTNSDGAWCWREGCSGADPRVFFCLHELTIVLPRL